MRRKKGASIGWLEKTLTGNQGLDEITDGGLPKGRPTLVCGSAGCGKTLLAMEFIVNGARHFNEPGVFMAFEENERELSQNVISLGYDLGELIMQKKLHIDYVLVERSEISETGEYDLEGLFIRLQAAIDSIGAKRVVLDTIESLFSGFSNENILRAELRRLFRWLKDKGVTAVITGESGKNALTRFGLEEYVADCVLMLDHRVTEQVSTRRIRIVKYRGSAHGVNEYPFLIDKKGISILPISSLKLDYEAGTKRIPTGVPRLDTMLGGKGFYRGSSILVSGTAGTGKSSMAAHLADSACKNGETCLFVSTEESMSQIIRNMNSIGIDLDKWVKKGLLHFLNVRPAFCGLEMHLLEFRRHIEDLNPSVFILDPVSAVVSAGNETEVKIMLTRLCDYNKMKNITSLFTNLVAGTSLIEATEIGISSLMDAWLQLRNVESNGERCRTLYLLKARGMAHSNQVREFLITDRGIELSDVYIGNSGVLVGSAKDVQEARDKAEARVRKEDIEAKRLQLGQRKKVMQAEIERIKGDYLAEENAFGQAILRSSVIEDDMARMASLRKADKVVSRAAGRRKR